MIDGAGLEDGGVGSDGTALLGVRAPLGDDYWTWEVACWNCWSGVRDWVSCEKGLYYLVDVVLLPFFRGRDWAGIEGAGGIRGLFVESPFFFLVFHGVIEFPVGFVFLGCMPLECRLGVWRGWLLRYREISCTPLFFKFVFFVRRKLF